MRLNIIIKLNLILVLLFCFALPVKTQAMSISERLKGRILLQVEESGEAWYVALDKNRHYMGEPKNAFELMRKQGVGITNVELNKIPIGVFSSKITVDSDSDGLSDALEQAIGTDAFNSDSDGDGFGDLKEVRDGFNPFGEDRVVIDEGFAEKKSGMIFLQVESVGEAWYINPEDKKRYFLGRPADAFALMRALGLGITNSDLELIAIAGSPYSINKTEEMIFERINVERRKRGLTLLKWNKQMAEVAREHSQNLSDENKNFASSMGKKCDFPLIYHEGLNFGLYQDERLRNREFYNFDMSAENIALVSSAKFNIQYYQNDGTLEEIDECRALKKLLDREFYEKIHSDMSEEKKVEYIKKEIRIRTEAYQNYFDFENVEVGWDSEVNSVNVMIDGWMNSEGHRENILMSDFNETGIGAVYTDGGYLIATQVFVRTIY